MQVDTLYEYNADNHESNITNYRYGVKLYHSIAKDTNFLKTARLLKGTHDKVTLFVNAFDGLTKNKSSLQESEHIIHKDSPKLMQHAGRALRQDGINFTFLDQYSGDLNYDLDFYSTIDFVIRDRNKLPKTLLPHDLDLVFDDEITNLSYGRIPWNEIEDSVKSGKDEGEITYTKKETVTWTYDQTEAHKKGFEILPQFKKDEYFGILSVQSEVVWDLSLEESEYYYSFYFDSILSNMQTLQKMMNDEEFMIYVKSFLENDDINNALQDLMEF